MAPRDIVAILLVSTLLIHPLAAIVSLALWNKSLTQVGGETLEAVVVATLAVIAGYLAEKTINNPLAPNSDRSHTSVRRQRRRRRRAKGNRPMTDITRNEHSVLRAILTNDFQDGGTWANCINDAREPSGIEGKALAGVVSSLAKKGLLRCSGYGRDATVEFASQEARDFATSIGPVPKA